MWQNFLQYIIVCGKMLSWCVSAGYEVVYAGNWGLVLGGGEGSDLCYGHIYPLRKNPHYPFVTTPALKDIAVKGKIPPSFWESNPGFPDSSLSPHWQCYHKFYKFKMISIWGCELHIMVPFLSHLKKSDFNFVVCFLLYLTGTVWSSESLLQFDQPTTQQCMGSSQAIALYIP
jgi:hypothetical protein